MTRGVLYVATSKRHLDAAATSAARLREHVEPLPVSVVTNPDLESHARSQAGIDDVVVTDDTWDSLRDKIHNIHRSPYDRTLYLDTDTLVAADPTPAFELLDAYDLAAAHAPYRRAMTSASLPDAYPEFNTGVIAFRDTERVQGVFEDWRSRYERQLAGESCDWSMTPVGTGSKFGREHGQPTFRRAVFESGVQAATLPPEYNYRGALAYAQDRVRIIHMGHSEPIRVLAERINDRLEPRAYDRASNRIVYADGSTTYLGIRGVDWVAKNRVVVGMLDRTGLLSAARRLYRRVARGV